MDMATEIHHIDQYRQMVVKVDPDAERIYSEDPRWENVTKQERQIAVNIINRLAGNEYPVFKTDRVGDRLFHHLVIYPKITIPDMFGQPMEIGIAFVPAEYVTVIQSGFWEAK